MSQYLFITILCAKITSVYRALGIYFLIRLLYDDNISWEKKFNKENINIVLSLHWLSMCDERSIKEKLYSEDKLFLNLREKTVVRKYRVFQGLRCKKNARWLVLSPFHRLFWRLQGQKWKYAEPQIKPPNQVELVWMASLLF